ncbi:alpha/beta fold hydrolase [Natronorubrum aibiense]|uniref:alpha/beta fold hydrolase n=1 Tax=Natronorubrum aibiense TaxID=348826 RepID=UPI001D0383FB|nr:alpha/beta hydrolase [Natronorubrum aibiense]
MGDPREREDADQHGDQSLGAMVTNDYRETLPEIDVPTLVTYGEESNLYAPETAKFMTDQIPDSELVGFSDVGHGVPLGMPEELTEELEGFL